MSVQRPMTQPMVALANPTHPLPQPPQLSASSPMFTSQPLSARWSQSPNPGVQPRITHAPPMHESIEFGAAHFFPQAPQLFTSSPVELSHPFCGLPSQSDQPGRQLATLHTPSAHDGMACGGLQGTAQPPQLAESFMVSASQPLSTLPSQSANPGLHLSTTQAPLWQETVALAGCGQAFLQAPQFFTSRASSISHPSLPTRLQSPNPALHSSPHWPAAQVVVPCAPVGHRVPQAPQLATSVSVRISHPSSSLVLQSENPGSQEPSTQAAAWHPGRPWAGVSHTAPHCPQWATSELASTQVWLQQVGLRRPMPVQSESAWQVFTHSKVSPRATQWVPMVQLSLVGRQGTHTALAGLQRGDAGGQSPSLAQVQPPLRQSAGPPLQPAATSTAEQARTAKKGDRMKRLLGGVMGSGR